MTRVLLVGGEAEARQTLARELRDGGYDVWDAPDGPSTLPDIRTLRDACGANGSAALVASCLPSDESARELLFEVRDADLPLPVILAAPADGEALDQLTRSRADAVLATPLDPDELFAALERVRTDRGD